MSRVEWTVPAKRDLESILTEIAGHNYPAAMRCVRLIRETTKAFKDFPHGGRPGEMPGTREIIVPRLTVYRCVPSCSWPYAGPSYPSRGTTLATG